MRGEILRVLFSVIKPFCFYKSRKLCLYSKNTKIQGKKKSLKSDPRCLRPRSFVAHAHVCKAYMLHVQKEGCCKATR